MGYSEYFDAASAIRPPQQALHEFLTETPAAELMKLRRVVRQRINEQEVTFNILGVPEGTNRPWTLDLLPCVVDPDEWAELGRGLRQRARVLSLMVADLFGAQTLLREGVLPPEVVFSSPGYLRACHGFRPAGGFLLHLYAADLGRGPDGRFVVFSDRTAAPTGSGYALENRLVLGSTLSELFNDYGVERLRNYFETVKRCVEEVAPGAANEPRVVVLSPGIHDESSFEHAYLARYLGYELVEGRDLTVRDRVVYMKTLSGLRRVDVIVRRIGDMWCDPLYLREDSHSGVPGLVTAAAAGNVAIINPLGMGLGETPALKPYLPAVARHLLGEELQLSSVESFWCGSPSSLRFVLEHLDQLVIKPAFEERKGDVLRPALMSSQEKAELRQQLQRSPGRYLAERWPELSTLPYFDAGKVQHGTLAVRTFLCRDGEDYQVMPGGLARVNAAPDGLFLSLSGDRASKDIWLPTHEHLPGRAPPRMPDGRVELRRGGVDLPSRLLDDLYWLGRYLERCDMTARLLRAANDRMGFEAGVDAPAALSAIVRALQAVEVLPATGKPQDEATRQALLRGAISAADNPGSLRNLCSRIHELTINVRSRLSRDAWHVFRKLGSAVPQRELLGEAAIEVLDEVLMTLSAATGTTFDNMVRGHTWLFLDLGRRIERASLTVAVVSAMLAPGASRVHMEILLEIADSLLTYRARYLSRLQAAPVVDLLLTDDSNPRSVAFQLTALRQHIHELPKLGGVVRSRAERRVIELDSLILTADIDAACAGEGEGLRRLLEATAELLWHLSDDVTQTWFSHATAARAVAAPVWVNEELEIPE
jgi:uncharacterized circularly permuted ATP-grasp superfamily protein/uncharacterized alpha-E superfamily protein